MSVYLDHNATTPLCAASHRAMEPFLGPRFGNPSSVHVFGQAARVAVDRARGQVKELLGVGEGDLVFTGSGTEAVFTAVVGAARAREERGRHVVLSAIEHPVVGDRTYGAAADDPADPGRVWLHSRRLAFEHPVTGETVASESPLPEDLIQSLERLGEPTSGAVP